MSQERKVPKIEIIRTVNIEAVKKEDFLSAEVYVYNAESKEIELADL